MPDTPDTGYLRSKYMREPKYIVGNSNTWWGSPKNGAGGKRDIRHRVAFVFLRIWLAGLTGRAGNHVLVLPTMYTRPEMVATRYVLLDH